MGKIVVVFFVGLFLTALVTIGPSLFLAVQGLLNVVSKLSGLG